MHGLQKPPWLNKRFSSLNDNCVKDLLSEIELNTVCEQACCPNIWECFSAGTATFLILGKTCTRNCLFCAVEHGRPERPDDKEPRNVALAVRKLGCKYIVVTSVTRDDLPDGGASHFSGTIRALYSSNPGIKVEVLIPDLKGDKVSLAEILQAAPTVLSHNIETVHRLYPVVRPQADYARSLALLREAKDINPNIPVKSGFMLGLGETDKEVLELLYDLRETGCEFLTLGQYLQPRSDLLPVTRYIPLEEFDYYKMRGLEMGFKAVASGPFVRSSYKAHEMIGGLF